MNSTVLHKRLVHLFGQPGIVTKEANLHETLDPLYREEAAQIASCVERRRREFSASRHCARKALAELGITSFPLLAAHDRAPLWPDSVVGSITHTDGCTDGYCGVAVARRSDALALGVDAEPSKPLPRDVWHLTLDASEQEAALAAPEPGIQARLVFSAKEATYKVLYPIFRQFLEFLEVHVEILASRGEFLSELVGSARALLPTGQKIAGRFILDAELLVTGVFLPAAGFALAHEEFHRHHSSC